MWVAVYLSVMLILWASIIWWLCLSAQKLKSTTLKFCFSSCVTSVLFSSAGCYGKFSVGISCHSSSTGEKTPGGAVWVSHVMSDVLFCLTSLKTSLRTRWSLDVPLIMLLADFVCSGSAAVFSMWKSTVYRNWVVTGPSPINWALDSTNSSPKTSLRPSTVFHEQIA